MNPELTKCFLCLEIIDEYRYKNNPTLIDELMVKWKEVNQATDEGSSIGDSREIEIIEMNLEEEKEDGE